MWNSFSDDGVSLLRRAAPKCSARDAAAYLNGSLPIRSRRCTATCYRSLLFCSFRNVYQPQRYDGAEPFKVAQAVAAAVAPESKVHVSTIARHHGVSESGGAAASWLRVLFVNRTQLNWRNAHSKRVASEKRVPEFMPPVRIFERRAAHSIQISC